MTSPHPLAAWVARNQTDEPRRAPTKRFTPDDEDLDDLPDRRRAGARRRTKARKVQVSRVRYS